MFCAFEGPPKIVRLHGRSDVLPAGSAEYQLLAPLFPVYSGARAIVRATLAAGSVTTPEGTWRSYREAFPSAIG